MNVGTGILSPCGESISFSYGWNNYLSLLALENREQFHLNAFHAKSAKKQPAKVRKELMLFAPLRKSLWALREMFYFSITTFPSLPHSTISPRGRAWFFPIWKLSTFPRQAVLRSQKQHGKSKCRRAAHLCQ
jgi:hypothetical protein